MSPTPIARTVSGHLTLPLVLRRTRGACTRSPAIGVAGWHFDMKLILRTIAWLFIPLAKYVGKIFIRSKLFSSTPELFTSTYVASVNSIF